MLALLHSRVFFLHSPCQAFADSYDAAAAALVVVLLLLCMAKKKRETFPVRA